MADVKDNDGCVVGSMTTYPDTPEDRARLIEREGRKAAELLKHSK